ncbi:cell surface protein SprA [candidate division KSB1 bacterium]|nr:cell surface protein SprA [candidate division KSB1 bacterium]
MYFWVLVGLAAMCLPAQAGIGLQRSLLGRSSNVLLARPVRGISFFGERPIFDVASDQIKSTVVIDSSYSIVTFSLKSGSVALVQPTVLTYDEYKQARIAADLRKQRKDETVRAYKKASQRRTGEGIAIDVPFKMKSKVFRRLFGGDNVGVRVQGQITINGNIRRQKFDELQAANQRNTNTSFHIDMIQQFNITGKIGQKVEVRVDQDSERLFDFQNSLKLTYTGEEDEIVQKVEAGNVALNLGTRLATFSGRNTGLFGLKTELKMGALKMTGIASLERGQKNRLSPRDIQQNVRPFDERDFLKNTYFFITGTQGQTRNELGEVTHEWLSFRDNYTRYLGREHRALAQPEFELSEIEVYVQRVGNIQEQVIQGRASIIEEMDSLDLPEDQWLVLKSREPQNHMQGQWLRLTPNTQYDVQLQLGYIRLKTPVQDGQAIAVAFRQRGTGPTDTVRTVFGTMRASIDSTLKLILIKPEGLFPTSLTWPLMWRHVYNLGASNIDRSTFKLKIARRSASSGQEETAVPGTSTSYLSYFQFDTQGANGGPADGAVDDIRALIDWNYGELHFITLQPFDTVSDWEENDQPLNWSLANLEVANEDSGGFAAPYLYTELPNTNQSRGSNWQLSPEYKGSTSVFQLGALVLENSEEVVLNGQQLKRGSDYTIDYTSGELKILNEAAKVQGADLQITFESGQFFQLDKKTLLGARAEYELWPDSYVGGMVLKLDEKTLDKRVRIGSEPLRNTLYDLNTSLKFKPKFLTHAVDALPFVRTDAASEFQIDAEVAQVFPNPNALENPRTGDYNGLAFLDDFEGSRRSAPLGLQRKQWTISSIPSDSLIDHNRARLRWWNPNTDNQVPVQEVFPDRQVNSNVANTLQSLLMEITPDEAISDAEKQRQWAGVMRYLGEGYSDQSRAQYLEFWVRLPRGEEQPDARLVCDLGVVSEDALPNDSMDTEDQPLEGQSAVSPQREYGNGICSDNEQTGIDGKFGADPQDSAYWNGLDNPPIPSWDDWAHESNSDEFGQVNGTENNKGDESGTYPDTEDLNNNDNLDQANSYFSYQLTLSESDPHIVGGNFDNKWRLFRIPLNEPLNQVGGPDLTNIRWARVYLTGCTRKTEIEMVQMDIVSNEWLPPSGRLDSTEQRVSAAVINTHENPGYISPPGVSGAEDPITKLVQREQSLVLKINRLGDRGSNQTDSLGGREFFIAKNLGQDLNLLEYKRLKMFVHGGGINTSAFDPRRYQLALRLGLNFNQIERDYYEIVLNVKPDWDPENNIDVAMNELSRLVALRQVAAFDTLQNVTVSGRYAYHDSTMGVGDSVVIQGNPTLSRVRFIALGVRLRDKSDFAEADEIWVDELRVSDIFKESGTAADVSASLRLADFVSLQGSFSQRDADFHNVNTRIGTQEGSVTWRGNATVNLQKLGVERWGFQLPLTVGYNEAVSTPRYIPGTDTRIEAAQVPDSVKTNSTTTSATARFSKTGNSKNPLVRWSIEKLSVGYDYSLDKRSDFNTEINRQTRENATAGYNFPTAKGRGVAPLFWIKRVPILALVGSPKIYWKPTKLQVTAAATKSDGFQQSRPTYRTIADSVYIYRQTLAPKQFTTSRGITTGFAFFDPITVDYSRTVRGAFEYVVDSVDTVNRRLKGGWPDLFNYNFGRASDIQQQVTTGYRPQFFGWLKPTFTYTAQYTWNNRDFSRENQQGVGNSRTVGGDLQLDFRAILGGGGGGRSGGRNERGGRNGGRGREGEGEQRNERGGPPLPGQERGRGARPDGDQPGPGEIEDRVPKGPGESGEHGPNRHRREEQEREVAPGGADSLGQVVDSLAMRPDSLGPPTPRREPGPSLGKRLATVVTPLRWAIMVLDPVTLSYDNSARHSQAGIHGAEADLLYQIGLSQKTGLDTVGGFTTPESRQLDQTYQARTGIRITSGIRTQFNYSKRVAETIGNTKTGSTEEKKFWLNSKQARSAFPFPEVTLDWQGLEKISFIDRFAESVSLTSALANSVRENWSGTASNVQSRDYQRQWAPLAGATFTFKGGFDSQVRYNKTQKFTDNVYQRSKGRETTSQVNGQVGYTVRTGFRIPVLWLKSMKLQNQTTVSLTLDYQTSKVEQTQSSTSDKFAVTSQTSQYSIQPNLTYTFSSTVQGRAYLTLQQTKNVVADTKTRTFEFGIQVNIAIRG